MDEAEGQNMLLKHPSVSETLPQGFGTRQQGFAPLSHQSISRLDCVMGRSGSLAFNVSSHSKRVQLE